MFLIANLIIDATLVFIIDKAIFSIGNNNVTFKLVVLVKYESYSTVMLAPSLHNSCTLPSSVLRVKANDSAPITSWNSSVVVAY